MHVWLATHNYPYEGTEIIGIYSTRESAIKACQEYEDGYYSGRTLEFNQYGIAVGASDQHYDVDEFEVEEE